MWLALAYNKEEHNPCSSKHPDVIQIDNDLYGELAYAFGALAVHFSNNDQQIKDELRAYNIHLFQTKVLPVQTGSELQYALQLSSQSRVARVATGCGLRYVSLLRDGVYSIPINNVLLYLF